MSFVATPPNLARLPDGAIDEAAIRAWSDRLVASVEEFLTQLATAASSGWSVDNYTVKRDLDGTAGTLADVRNVLCTLIDDAKNRSPSILGG